MTTGHRGAGMNLTPELDVRAVLLTGLHELANDRKAIDELVNRVDALNDGSQDTWTADLRKELLRLLDPNSGSYVLIRVGYPTEHAHLPALSLVLGNANENDGGAVIGDTLSRTYDRVGAVPTPPASIVTPSGQLIGLTPLPDPLGGTDYPAGEPQQRVYQNTQIGTDWSSTVEVGCWSVAVETALLLQAMARWALFRGKGQLQKAGVYDIRFDEGGAQPDERLEPRVGYVPIIRIHLDWTYRQTRREGPMPTQISSLSNCFTS